MFYSMLVSMPTESTTLTEQRVRKERALASLRELQLAEAEGKLLKADQVEATWAGAISSRGTRSSRSRSSPTHDTLRRRSAARARRDGILFLWLESIISPCSIRSKNLGVSNVIPYLGCS